MTRKQDENENGGGSIPGAGNMQPAKPRDVHEANLEDLLTQLYDAAEDSFAEARQLSHDRDTQVEVLMQAATLPDARRQRIGSTGR